MDNRIPNARWPAVGVLDSRPDKHVEAGGFSLKDRGSTPLASTILIINDLRNKIARVILLVIQYSPWVAVVLRLIRLRTSGQSLANKETSESAAPLRSKSR